MSERGVDGSDPAPVRLFVALPVPDHVRMLGRAAAAPAEAVAPELTWTRPEGWHLTLAFLGDAAAEQVSAVEATIAEVVGAVAGPIGCRLAGADRFAARALYLAVEDDPAGAIASLGADLQAALEAAALPVRRKEVRPHLTLARASRRGASVTESVRRAVAPVEGSWEADTVELVRSELGSGPARYTPIGAWHLGSVSG